MYVSLNSNHVPISFKIWILLMMCARFEAVSDNFAFLVFTVRIIVMLLARNF